MYLRSFAITVALAAGLLVILVVAFVTCIPGYIVNLASQQPPRRRVVAVLPTRRLSRR